VASTTTNFASSLRGCQPPSTRPSCATGDDEGCIKSRSCSGSSGPAGVGGLALPATCAVQHLQRCYWVTLTGWCRIFSGGVTLHHT
jgi:hypothetical protein